MANNVSSIDTISHDHVQLGMGGICLLWRRLLLDIMRKFRMRAIALCIFMMINGLLDGIGMAMLLPLINLMGVGSLTTNPIAQRISLISENVGLQISIELVLFVIIVIFLAQSALIILQGWLIAKVETSYVANWRNALLEKFLGAPLSFFIENRTGGLVYLLVGETERVGRAFYLSAQLVSTLLVSIVYFAVAIYFSWQFTVFILFTFLLLGAVIAWTMLAKGYKTGRNYGILLDHIQSVLTDFFIGIKFIKATAVEMFAIKKMSTIMSGLEKEYFCSVFYPYILKALMEVFAIVILCAYIYLGAKLIHIQPDTLLIILAIFFRLVPKFFNLQYSIQLLSVYLPGYDCIDRIAAHAKATGEARAIQAPSPIFRESPEITVKNLTVRYGDSKAISGLSLIIPKNTSLGIVGGSGAGKSTFVDALLGLVTPETGVIYLDGKPLNEISIHDWRFSIGYVTQETVLFNDTVRENILWGNENIEESDLIKYAKLAHAHDFICDLPKGYDTIIGERGICLSGGQRQRLALARALAKRPVLLILDEATNALDSASEQEVLSAIDDLNKQITIIMIAHNLSTLRNTNKIIVLNKGLMVEEGTWRELLVHDSHLSQLWKLQNK